MNGLFIETLDSPIIHWVRGCQSAKQAREIVKSNKDKRIPRILRNFEELIYDKILHRAREGYSLVSIRQNQVKNIIDNNEFIHVFSKYFLEKLKEQGYKVEFTQEEFDNYSILISWIK